MLSINCSPTYFEFNAISIPLLNIFSNVEEYMMFGENAKSTFSWVTIVCSYGGSQLSTYSSYLVILLSLIDNDPLKRNPFPKLDIAEISTPVL